MDGIPDLADNCPSTPNRGQGDADGDGVGDACQAAARLRDAPSGTTDDGLQPQCPGPDADRDGIGNACDTDAGGTGAPRPPRLTTVGGMRSWARQWLPE